MNPCRDDLVERPFHYKRAHSKLFIETKQAAAANVRFDFLLSHKWLLQSANKHKQTNKICTYSVHLPKQLAGSNWWPRGSFTMLGFPAQRGETHIST